MLQQTFSHRTTHQRAGRRDKESTREREREGEIQQCCRLQADSPVESRNIRNRTREVVSFWKRQKMLCAYWLLAVVVVYVCSPAVGELCWNDSVCSDLSSKDSLLVPICFHLCPSVFLNEYPGLSALVQSSDDESLSLGVLLASLTSKEKIQESNPSARSEERRSSYSMEHFRWGKPAGRKRRPIKVYSLPLDVEDSSKDSYVLQVRRQLGSVEDEGNGDVDLQGSITPKPASLLSPQERNYGTYRMNHFRWGSPTATKRYAGFAKPWEEGSLKPVPKQLRNIIIKDSE